jgi:ribose transport system substrate-binding protein
MKLNSFRWTIVPLGALTLAALIAGAAQQKKLQLAFVSNNAASFWTIAKAGTAEAAKEIGEGNVSVDFRIPSESTPASQQSILNDLVARGEDGIAVSPIDPANQTTFLNKIAGKTLLICHDSDAPASKRVCYIGTDNTAAGMEAGKLIKEALPSGGKIMLFVGKRDAQNAKERYDGIVKEIAGSKVEIIDVRTDDADTVRAQNNAQDTLVKYPDIAGMVGLYSYNGPAILNAVRSSGKIGKVKIICFDEDADTLAGVANGAIYGTVVQQPFEFGKQAIHKMYDYLRGDKAALAAGRIIIPTLSLKKDTVGDFQKKLNAILGK